MEADRQILIVFPKIDSETSGTAIHLGRHFDKLMPPKLINRHEPILIGQARQPNM